MSSQRMAYPLTLKTAVVQDGPIPANKYDHLLGLWGTIEGSLMALLK